MDLTEAIEEGDPSAIENSDFAAATNVPFTDILPTQQYLPDEVNNFAYLKLDFPRRYNDYLFCNKTGVSGGSPRLGSISLHGQVGRSNIAN